MFNRIVVQINSLQVWLILEQVGFKGKDLVEGKSNIDQIWERRQIFSAERRETSIVPLHSL